MPRIYKGSETILKLLIDVPSTSVIDKIKIALFTTDRSIAMEFYADSITLYGNIAYLNAPEWTFMEMQDGIINYIAQGEINNKPFIFERQSNYILKSSDGFEMSEIMNGYYTKEETDVKLEAEQDKLVSGKTIKTINGESVLGAGNITIETDLTGYATEQYVNDAIANIDIPEGTGGATKYVIDLRADDGYSMYRLDANILLQADKICYVRYVKYNTENGTEGFQSILNGGRFETDSEFIPYVWSIIEDKLFTWDFSDGGAYAIPTITPIGGSGEGGDSGAYILEGVEPIFEAEFWYHPETGEFEMIYDNNDEYSTSEERKAHNKKVIDAILEGKCKSLYYKKFVGNVDEKVIEVDENGREHRKTVNGYQYYPLSWTEYELNWGVEYIRFEGKFIENYMQTPKERVIVLNKETAEIQADSQMTYAIGSPMYVNHVIFLEDYRMERRVFEDAYFNDKPVCVVIEKQDGSSSRCLLNTDAKVEQETNIEYDTVWCNDGEGNRYEWVFKYYWNEGTYDEYATPTITPMGGGSGDSYTKEEIDSMIGDINNILTSI